MLMFLAAFRQFHVHDRELLNGLTPGTCACQVMRADAGITGFHKWFSHTFPTAVTSVGPQQQELFDHVCIDMNQAREHTLKDENILLRTLW